MPLYIYQCDGCQRKEEVVQSFSGEPPLCCGQKMRRIPAVPAIIRIEGVHSEGYKRDYGKEYRRRMGKE